MTPSEREKTKTKKKHIQEEEIYTYYLIRDLSLSLSLIYAKEERISKRELILNFKCKVTYHKCCILFLLLTRGSRILREHLDWLLCDLLLLL